LGYFDETGSERFNTFLEYFSTSNEELSKYARNIHGTVSAAVLEECAGLVRLG
jgi:hypothetical protein